MKVRWAFVCLVLCIVNSNADDDIGVDYYFGLSPLRSESDYEGESSCKNPFYKYSCLSNCPMGHQCFMKNCMCVDLYVGYVKDKNTRFEYERSQQDDKNPPGFVDLTKKRALSKNPYYDDYPKPALRHHIAHFCPNLDDARVCIRKCMPLGKPAFCGKDHACYCGHRYQHSPADEKTDPKAMYAQFKDLYKKYFGDSYKVNSGFSTSDEHD